MFPTFSKEKNWNVAKTVIQHN